MLMFITALPHRQAHVASQSPTVHVAFAAPVPVVRADVPAKLLSSHVGNLQILPQRRVNRVVHKKKAPASVSSSKRVGSRVQKDQATRVQLKRPASLPLPISTTATAQSHAEDGQRQANAQHLGQRNAMATARSKPKIVDTMRDAKRQAQIQEEKRQERILEQKRLAHIAAQKRQARIQEQKRQERILHEKRLAQIAAEKRQAKIEHEKRLAQIAAKKRDAKLLEQKRLRQLQDQRYAALLDAKSSLTRHLGQFFTTFDDRRDWQVLLDIRLFEDGRIASLAVAESSGDSRYDQLAMHLVYRAAPLPLPQDPDIRKDMLHIDLMVSPQSILSGD